MAEFASGSLYLEPDTAGAVGLQLADGVRSIRAIRHGSDRMQSFLYA